MRIDNLMNDPMMATYQNLPAPMDFPVEFLEQPSVSAPMPQQTKINTYFSPNTGYSSNNSSLSSSRNRVCDDSGISSAVTLSNETDNSSSMHFLTSTLNTTVNECMDSTTPMNFGNNDLLEDFEPMMRDRSSTWPMRHPNNDAHSNNSPVLLHERIEEESLYSQNGSQASIHLTQDPFMNNQMNTNVYPNQMAHSDSHEQGLNYESPTNYSEENSPHSDDEDDFQGGAVQKRSQTRRNAWGNMSYADLITQAIMSTPDQRLTLSQIYEWMCDNVPYFSDKGDSNSSAGWKNSIRHNLSLHSRFMRIQNEGAGKSSWWVINPEAKNINKSRRRATMDASTKHMIEKKRRGARKRVELQGSMNVLVNPRKASQPEFYFNRAKEEPENDSDYDSFRSRTLSNISAPGGSQISPTFNPNNEDFAYQSWAPNTTIPQTTCNNTMNDIMSRTDQICLDADGEYSQLGQNQQQLGVYSAMPQQISPNFQIKQEEVKPHFQQTSYQELKVVRGVDQQLQNPLLRNQFNQQQNQFQQPAPQFTNTNQYEFGNNRNGNQPQHFPSNQQPMGRFVQQTVTQQQMIPGMQQHQIVSPPMTQTTTINQSFMQVAPNVTLPKDLENLNTFVPPGCELDSIDEIIRQELSTSNNLQFDF